ncbi:MAG: hypothetical protein KDE46_30785, partial [Caldilineaceae bacterium]|nr:hypothetical protein [Caldilineaceae bacterium]
KADILRLRWKVAFVRFQKRYFLHRAKYSMTAQGLSSCAFFVPKQGRNNGAPHRKQAMQLLFCVVSDSSNVAE